MIFMGKSMVSGSNFPLNQSIETMIIRSTRSTRSTRTKADLQSAKTAELPAQLAILLVLRPGPRGPHHWTIGDMEQRSYTMCVP